MTGRPNMAPRRWLQAAALLAIVLCHTGLAAADDRAAFARALERASAQYRIAMTTLDTGGREQTAAEVRLFRQAWQQLVDRFGKNRPAGLADDDSYLAMMMDVDVRLVGALIVIDIGSRDAARAAMKPIGDVLARWQRRAMPSK